MMLIRKLVFYQSNVIIDPFFRFGSISEVIFDEIAYPHWKLCQKLVGFDWSYIIYWDTIAIVQTMPLTLWQSKLKINELTERNENRIFARLDFGWKFKGLYVLCYDE